MKKLFTLLLLSISIAGYAQKQANIWYFGNLAGLDFNSGAPVVLTNSAMNQFEGSSSIADNNGSLLFYTDGISVWNANHVTMANGFGLFGNGSTTQSALIVQQPNSVLYYIFTGGAQGGGGFNYSIVDMSLNGGLGDVTVKNTLLFTPSSEKATAVFQANGIDVWIITHDYNGNNFQSYALTAAGFNATPIVSSVGPSFGGTNDVIGYLKPSVDGTKLAMALSNADQFWLFSLDPVTGVVSNPMLLNSSGSVGGGAYGVEFSPNSNILYGSVEMASPNINLYQWDLSSGNVATINASRVNLPVTLIDAVYMGSLSLAPDGKIYFTRNTCSYLGCISDPDVLGLGCNVIDSAIFLQGATCVYGLPNINQSYYNSGFSFTNLCFGDSTLFTIPNTTNLFGAQWDFDDPSTGASNTSFLYNPSHYFSAPGTYQVTIIKFYATYNDTVVVPVVINPVPSISLGPDTTFCTGTTFVLQAGSGYTTYLWQDNSTDSVFSTTQTGTFWVTVSNNGCSATDTIVLSAAVCSVPAANFLSSDTTFCGKQCLDFTDISTNSPTSWQWLFPGADSTSSNQQNPVGICYNSYGNFDVTLIACNAAGCDTLSIPSFITEYQLPAAPVITQSNDTLYATYASNYAWYNTTNPGTIISTSSFYTTSNGGSYFVIITDSNGCQNSSTIFISTGINSIFTDENMFVVSPNPANVGLDITINPTLNLLNTYLVISDIPGQILHKQQLSGYLTHVDLHAFANGIYFVKLVTPGGMLIKKVIVNH